MEYFRRLNCRYCGSEELSSILDLGLHPPSDSFIDYDQIKNEKKYPLELFFCKSCFLLQLCDVISPKILFGGEFLYLSSSSKALVDHFKNFTNEVSNEFNLSSSDTVVDIGCNDGLLLNSYRIKGLKTIGIEPSELADIAKANCYKVYRGFFNSNLVNEIIKRYGQPEIVTATNVFPHIDEIDLFVQALTSLIGNKGVFIIEASYALDLIDNNLFDTIYHEHLCYLSLTPLVKFLDKYDLEVFKIKKNILGASGPAIRVYIQSRNGKNKISTLVKQVIIDEEQWGIKNLKKYKNFSKRVVNIKKN